jgi:hypothetical protein
MLRLDWLVMPAVSSLVALAACGGTSEMRDGGGPPVDGATVPTAMLEVVGTPSTALQFGEEATLRILYRELDGSPIVDAPVAFALVGRANDSSLGALEATTDDMGETTVRILAGATPSAFGVRVTAARAAPLVVDVSVSDAGFGAISVTVEWEGDRMVEQTEVAVFAGMRCDDESVLTGEPDRSRILASGSAVAELRALPAEIGYAIAARGLGPTGTRVAYGCVDDVIIEAADTVVEATVAMTDLPLIPDGGFTIGLEVDTSASAIALSRAVARGGRGVVESAGGSASFLLDAVEAHLRATGATSEADSIAGERASAFLDDALDARLTAESVGPARAIDLLAEALEARTAFLTIAGVASLETTMDGFESTLMVTSMTTHGLPPADARLAIDIGVLGVPPDGRLTMAPIVDEDAFEVSELGATVPLGALGVAALDAMAEEARLEGAATLLEEPGGCATFEAWVSAVPEIALACDATCAHTACRDALETAWTAAQLSLVELDAARSVITVAGRAEARDELGNLTIDTFEAPSLSGRYANADGSDFDEIVAALSGARMLE